MTELAALDQRVTRLEGQISSGFDRIESLLRQEITDLKTEQIKDLRENNSRLADDQRRLWDRITAMESRENQRVGEHGGQHRVLGAVWAFVCAACGGIITLFGTWFMGGNSPPPHH